MGRMQRLLNRMRREDKVKIRVFSNEKFFTTTAAINPPQL